MGQPTPSNTRALDMMASLSLRSSHLGGQGQPASKPNPCFTHGAETGTSFSSKRNAKLAERPAGITKRTALQAQTLLNQQPSHTIASHMESSQAGAARAKASLSGQSARLETKGEPTPKPNLAPRLVARQTTAPKAKPIIRTRATHPGDKGHPACTAQPLPNQHPSPILVPDMDSRQAGTPKSSTKAKRAERSP